MSETIFCNSRRRLTILLPSTSRETKCVWILRRRMGHATRGLRAPWYAVITSASAVTARNCYGKWHTLTEHFKRWTGTGYNYAASRNVLCFEITLRVLSTCVLRRAKSIVDGYGQVNPNVVVEFGVRVVVATLLVSNHETEITTMFSAGFSFFLFSFSRFRDLWISVYSIHAARINRLLWLVSRQFIVLVRISNDEIRMTKVLLLLAIRSIQMSKFVIPRCSARRESYCHYWRTTYQIFKHVASGLSLQRRDSRK